MELDSVRPRTLGGGIRTQSLETIAAQNQGTVRTDPIVRSFSEAEWRKKVDAKYAEMRAEEEEWIKQMQKLIDERERDIGITTAR